MTTPEMITALDEIIAATRTMGSEYGHPRVASIAEDIKRTLQSQQQPPQAPGPLYTTVPEILAHMRDVASRMGNGDYLIARIEEVLAARAIELENIAGENRKLRTALMAIHSPESPQAFVGRVPTTPGHPTEDSPRCLLCGRQEPHKHELQTQAPAEATHEDPAASAAPAATSPPERHIDTPDELLEILAGISSDPQVEGLSLAQKASSMALLHIAKALQQIAGDVRCLTLRKIRDWDAPAVQSPGSPQEPS